jgi:twitching motility protein PilJ
MAKNANALLSSDQINPETAYQLGQDLRDFPRGAGRPAARQRRASGWSRYPMPCAREKLLELQEVFGRFEKQANQILKNMPQLVEAKRAAREIFDESEQLLTLTSKL